nr:RDD family protein [Streptomyces sp. HNM0574]
MPSRALSVCIDLVLAWTLYVLLSLALLAVTASLDDAALAAVQVGLFLLVLVGVPVAVETLSQGRSVGKLLCGLRVVREDGGPVRFRHALVRGATGLVEIQMSFGVIACAASLVSARGRRLGDVFGGALVVRERVPAAQGAPVPPAPPGQAGSFDGLDLSRVPDGLWLAVRQYLTRAGQLDADVGRSMAGRLAADVAAWTGAPAPEGLPAPAYLAGVLAERQRREAQRAFGAGQFERAPGPDAVVAPASRAGGERDSAVRASAAPPVPEERDAGPGGGSATGFVPPA